MKYTKRFIEETFPVKEVSEISAQEKNIRHGHISTLHIWWARRPLAASRSTAFASLIPFPDDEETIKYFWSVLNPLFNKGILPKEKKTKNVVDAIKTFIIEMSRWENSNNKDIVEAARKMILHFNDGVPPKVLDPFGGGGSIPLECLRLGCETYSNDLNPVAVLIQKCTLEYPQKYGKPGYVEREIQDFGKKRKEKIWTDNVLLEDVKYWSKWVLEEAKKEFAHFYPRDKDGSIPVGYIWARTINCQNPACNAEIPLMRQFWLSKKNNKKVSLYPNVKNKKVIFEIVGDGYGKWPVGFDPDEGTTSRSIATCLICGSTINANSTRSVFSGVKSAQKLVAIVNHKIKETGKIYRLPNDNDIKIFQEAASELSSYLAKNFEGFDNLPEGEIPFMSGVFNVPLYGINNWYELFNKRQNLSLLVFVNCIKKAFLLIKNNKSLSDDYIKGLVSYLGIIQSKLTDYNSTLCTWVPSGEFVGHTFVRQALGMVWDYFEVNPDSLASGDWNSSSEWVARVLTHFSEIDCHSAQVSQQSANQLLFSDKFFDAVFTDPPYYNSVPYADLSDYFYVWLKHSLSQIHPELFLTPLTPKKNEITEMKSWDPIRYPEKDKDFFEENLKIAFREIYRTLHIGGLSIIVYAHKTTEGWETLINSLVGSGLILTSAWPISTEMEQRTRARDSAALASSIYIVCRKVERQPTAFYNDVKEETKNYLGKKLDRLWNEGISGADFFIAAIGSAIEVFGKYQSVIDYEGNIIRANKLLEDVRIIVTDYAVKKILHNGFATGISDLTRFYVLCRWEFKAAKIPFDEANKLAHSCHIELADYWVTKSFIQKNKEFIQILGPQDRDLDDIKDSGELIDVLHYAVKLWEKGNKAEMQKVLNESGYAKSDSFFRVAQAISETLPNESKEKKLLEGFLNLRERISEGFKVKEDTDKGLFD